MTILGIGLDVIDLQRIERLHGRHGETFIRRFCREGEWQRRAGGALIEHLGGLFAAKEAVFKVLGTGWGHGVGFRQIEIARSSAGAPQVALHGAAAEHFRNLGGERLLLSITHERRYAAAVAILEGRPPAAEPPRSDPTT